MVCPKLYERTLCFGLILRGNFEISERRNLKKKMLNS